MFYSNNSQIIMFFGNNKIFLLINDGFLLIQFQILFVIIK
jgi:hypothetical protein